MFGAKEYARSIARDIFDHVSIFLSAVISATGVPFRIFIGENRAERRQYLGVGVVFGRNHFDAVDLASLLADYRIGDVRVERLKLCAIGVHGRLPSRMEDGPTFIGCPGERLIDVALPDGVPSKLASHATRQFRGKSFPQARSFERRMPWARWTWTRSWASPLSYNLYHSVVGFALRSMTARRAAVERPLSPLADLGYAGPSART